MSTQVTPLVETHRQLPTPTAEGQQGAVRGSRYNEIMVQNVVPSKQVLADEGSYFTGCNPTPGTAVTYSIAAGATSYSNVSAFAVFKNNDNAANPKAKRVYLDYMKLILSTGTAPATTVSIQVAVHLDNVTRTPTAASVAVTPTNCNMDDNTGSIAQLWTFSGAVLTVPAPSGSNRIVARTSIPTSQAVISDEYAVQFGPQDQHGAIPGLTAAKATAPGKFTACAPPVVIGPQQWAVIYLWWLSATTTAPAFEYEFAWWER